jgi:hypothetical protein
MSAIRAKQQNRSELAATVIFDNHAQRIQNLLERDSRRDHFQKTLFPGEQRLPALALADVDRSTSITFDFAGSPESRSPHPLDMLNRPVGKRDPKFHVKGAFFPNCCIEILLDN